MAKRYILALDQGTTSSRAILFNHSGNIVNVARKEFEQIFPKPGWVEHRPEDILSSQKEVIRKCVNDSGIRPEEIDAIGITNQRETTVVWEKATGKPLYNAIVWQDRRTSEFCDQLKSDGKMEMIRDKTGLIVDAYFSGTKLKWILDQNPDARKRAENGELAFGTIDSWLLWNLTKNHVHATDVTNASRTMLFHIRELRWDNKLLELFSIPRQMLPQVKSCSEIYGLLDPEILGVEIPIAGIAGDQQAALFGQLCLEEGMAKNTYGTGCFLVLNTGKSIIRSENNMLSTIAWKLGDETTYALEGSVFIGGAVIQWLRDGLGILNKASESETLAGTVRDNGGIYFVPALTGLGAPHWDQYARGSIFGITRGTKKGHIVRAALESICYQVRDVVQAMNSDTNKNLKELRVDGGAVSNNMLLQFQADILDTKVIRPVILETTALGAAYLAGLATKFWASVDSLKNQWKPDKEYLPAMDQDKRALYLEDWEKAVARSKAWLL